MTNRRWLRWAVLAGFALGRGGVAGAQDRVVDGGRTVVEPTFTSWRFADPLSQDSLALDGVWQFTLPLVTSFTTGSWTFDLATAASTSQVRLADGTRVSLSGLSDVRIRTVGRVVGDQLLVTAALNVPTGKTRLRGFEVDVARVVATPALHLPARQVGLGVGATAGLVLAWRAGPWGLAVGTSFEARGRYAPVEAQIAGVAAPTDLDPGNAVRFSIGADRLVGQGRFSLLVAADVFGEDQILASRPGRAPVEGTFRLGPQLSADVLLDLGVPGFQAFTLWLSDRYRSEFTDITGVKAAGSAANRLDLGAEAATGGGIVVGITGRFDTGLEVDQTLLTAAAASAMLTLGYRRRADRVTVQPFVRFGVARLDTGPLSTSAVSLGGGLTISVR